MSGPLPPAPPGTEGDVTLREVQAQVDAWIGQFEEGYWPPLANLARLIEEVGELSRELNHRYGPKKKKAEEPDADLALELADVLFVVVALANSLQLDLSAAVGRTLEKYRVRDSERWVRKAAPVVSGEDAGGGRGGDEVPTAEPEREAEGP